MTSNEPDHDRELIELLNELRIALPGVQVLFAFLLTVPFTRGFTRLTELDRAIFLASVLTTAAASAFLIAPSAYHRLRFRQHDKEALLRTGNRLTLAGLTALLLAMAQAIWLVTDVLYGIATATAIAAATVVTFAWLWYGLALRRSLTR